MAACLTCHVVRGEGRNIGPELSQVGARLKRDALFESLVEPSKAISQGYTTVTLTPNDGTPPQTGFLLDESGDAFVLKSVTGETVTLAKSSANVSRAPVSLMPEGLIQGLTAQELADLLAYLSSLR